MRRVTPDQLLALLTKKQRTPAVLLLGADAYYRDLCRTQLIEACVPENAREWGVSRLSADDASLDAILQRAQSVPMLSPSQVIFVTDVEVWEKLEDNAGKVLLGRFGAYCDDPAPFTVLVLEAAALDKRMKLYKGLSRMMPEVDVSIPKDAALHVGAALPRVEEMARNLGVTLDPEAARQLVEFLDGDLSMIRIEMEKLAAYVGERKKILPADVEAVVVSAKKYSIWQLVDVLAARKREPAFTFLDSVLREGEQPPAVVGALAWMYRKLLGAQELPRNASEGDAARRLGLYSATAALALRESRKISRTRLRAGLAALYEADSRLKSGAANQRAVMEFLVARLTASEVESRARIR